SASGQTAPTLTLTGQITETTSSSLTFNNYGGDQNLTPTIILNNTGTASSWLGGTTLDNVFLNIENSSSFPSSGSITFTLGTGSILTFDLAGSDTYTGSGNIIGNNSNLIIQNGTINLSGSISDLNISLIGGTTTLSGSNAINTLNLSLNGAIGSSPTLIISSPIGSSSTLALNGGTLEIEAIVPFTSATILSGSTITVSSGEAITISSLETTVPSSNPILTLSGSGTVSIPIFDVASSSLTVDGVLGGASGLNLKQSSGTIKNQLTLTDVNTYVGETLLEDGTTLLINLGAQIGIISDNIYINSDCTLTDNGVIYVNTLTNNGTLNGSGTINGLTVENYKLIYGGNSPGTLTINGNLISYSGSTILVSITPTETSLLDVSGTVTIEPGVTLDIQPTAGCYSKFTDFVILSSDGGLTGTFSDIQIDSFLLTPQVFYGSEGALLRINRAKLRDLPIQGNVKEIAGAIDTLIDSGHSLCGIMGDFILSPLKDIENALEELQPSLFKGLTVAQENNAVKVAETINYRMNVELDSIHCHPIHSKDKTKTSNCNREKKPFQIWVTGLGDALNQSNTTFAKSFQVGYHESMGGVVLGADYHFANCLYAGVLGAYTDSDIKWNKSRGKGDIQSAYTGLYFSAIGKMFYGNISVLGALSHYDAHRNIDLPSGYHKAKNKHGGAQLLSHADTGINLGWGGFTIRPFNSYDYITQTENAYTETGAGDLNLSI
ncbi:MAG: autotransporter domain-containing protein, partial [Verrucomicrobia bacterium]|nr:autotransporter domain-containing protein [Verrucomicrobiota bacterium]